MGSIIIRRMRAEDALIIQRQASQRVQLGLTVELDVDSAAAMAAHPEAWTAEDDARILACYGLIETFPGAQGVAWAILADNLGAAHLTISRHVRARITGSPLRRIEAIVRAACPAEIAWAKLAGLAPAHLLRNFGAASEDHVLCERIA